MCPPRRPLPFTGITTVRKYLPYLIVSVCLVAHLLPAAAREPHRRDLKTDDGTASSQSETGSQAVSSWLTASSSADAPASQGSSEASSSTAWTPALGFSATLAATSTSRRRILGSLFLFRFGRALQQTEEVSEADLESIESFLQELAVALPGVTRSDLAAVSLTKMSKYTPTLLSCLHGASPNGVVSICRYWRVGIRCRRPNLHPRREARTRRTGQRRQ